MKRKLLKYPRQPNRAARRELSADQSLNRYFRERERWIDSEVERRSRIAQIINVATEPYRVMQVHAVHFSGEGFYIEVR